MNAKRDFVERLGRLFSDLGLPRTAGQVLGYLVVAEEEPVALSELAQELGLSKASASLATRLLERYRAIERVHRPGDRQAYYRLAEDAWRRVIEQDLAFTQEVAGIAAQAARALPGPGAQKRLSELARVYRRYGEKIKELLEEEWPDSP